MFCLEAMVRVYIGRGSGTREDRREKTEIDGRGVPAAQTSPEGSAVGPTADRSSAVGPDFELESELLLLGGRGRQDDPDIGGMLRRPHVVVADDDLIAHV